MKRLFLLSLVLALSLAQKLAIPSAFSSDFATKTVQGGVPIQSQVEFASDGNAFYTKVVTIYNGTQSILDFWAFKSNSTSYELSGAQVCSVRKLDANDTADLNPFEVLNEKAKGPGAKCQGSGGRAGYTWTLDSEKRHFEFCISEDGTTPLSINEPSSGLDHVQINFKAGAPPAKNFQLPESCLDADMSKLNLPKAYFVEYAIKTQQTRSGNVTRQENGDGVILGSGPYGYWDDAWYKASEKKTYRINYDNTCAVSSGNEFYQDELDSIRRWSSLWVHSKEKCAAGEGSIWKQNYGVSQLCTKKDGTVPVWSHDGYQNITWTNFRTTDLPPFKLPASCSGL